MFDFLSALFVLVATGDYTPTLAPLMGEEDSALVNLVMSVLGY